MAVGAINSLLSRQMVVDHSPIHAVGRDGTQPEQQPIKLKPTIASAPHLFDSLERYMQPFAPLAMPKKAEARELHPYDLKSILTQIEKGKKDPRNYSELTRLDPRLV